MARKRMEAIQVGLNNFKQRMEQLNKKSLVNMRTQKIIYPYYRSNKWHDPFEEYPKYFCEALVNAVEKTMKEGL